MRLPPRLGSGLPLSLGFPARGSIAVSHASTSLASFSNSGIARASQVLDASLHTCRALRGPRQTLQDLAFSGPFVLASGTLTPWPSASPLDEAVSSFRECGLPCGLHGSLGTLHTARSALGLLPVRNPRYGWLARPYPAGTSTRQETPSFAWRTNVQLQLRSPVGAAGAPQPP